MAIKQLISFLLYGSFKIDLLIIGGVVMYDIFRCPKCHQPMSLPSCSCNYKAVYHKGVYQLTDDPYMVKDDSAEIKFILEILYLRKLQWIKST